MNAYEQKLADDIERLRDTPVVYGPDPKPSMALPKAIEQEFAKQADAKTDDAAKTFRDHATASLVNNGLFPQDAEAVLAQYIASDAGEPMAERMDHYTEGYPPNMIGIVWFGVKAVARDWITENCPNAWYRPMFDEPVNP